MKGKSGYNDQLSRACASSFWMYGMLWVRGGMCCDVQSVRFESKCVLYLSRKTREVFNVEASAFKVERFGWRGHELKLKSVTTSLG